MKQNLLNQLKKTIAGDVATDEPTLHTHSMDKSIFAVKPQVVVFPKDGRDVCKLVRFVAKQKKKNKDLTLTPRAAGTDMSGGDLNTSIVVSFMKYFNHKPLINDDTATVEPGVYYRDFERETLKHGLLYPPYPSSREICAMGGIVNNNAGGEKSLQYGKAEDYVLSMNMVLADGNEYTLKPLPVAQLAKKMQQKTFEGQIYKKLYKLITENYDLIKQAKPDVSKNAAGYYLWNVYDREKGIFDVTKLLVGAQGTLGLMTKANLRLVPVKKHAEMLVVLLYDFKHLAEIINLVLPLQPESFETYDDKTLKLALEYFPDFAKKLGTKNRFETAWKFLPEFLLLWEKKLPKLVLQVEFTGNDPKELEQKIQELKEKLKPLHPKTKVVHDEEEKKYWLIRRDSFGLLSSKIKEMYASPFIDDIVVKPEYLPEFLPRFNRVMKKYPSIKATFAGHVGNGNFHVIPLVKLTDPQEQTLVFKLAEEVFKLVMEYKGSTSGEHNDGWIRTPYLPLQFDKKILKLFEETKKIFDPEGIFNPHKKTNPDLNFAKKHIRTEW